MASYPHCDSDVLHAPGTCQHCDHFPEAQASRAREGINFTGETDPAKQACPATQKRPLELIERWYGNVRETPARAAARAAYFEELARER